MSIGDISLLRRTEGPYGGEVYVNGTRACADTIADRFVAGESIGDIATDYDVSCAAVLQALRLVLYAKGTSLLAKRPRWKIAAVLPLKASAG